MRIPNLNALMMFDAAARHLNFRLAAQELNLTQGAVAQQVRRFEASLGLQLFHRQARGLALTDVGREYHQPVRRAMALLEEATARLRPQGPRVTLSVTPSFAAKWLVPRLARFAESYPDLDLRILASERLSDFHTDAVDLSVRQGRAPFGEGLESTFLASLDLFAVCSPDYAADCGPISGLEDFAAHRLIEDSHGHWRRLLHPGQGLQRILQFNHTTLAMDAAANGQGVALVPQLLAAQEVQNGRLAVLWREQGDEQRGYHLVHPAGATSATCGVVKAWIEAEVRRTVLRQG